MKYRKERKQVAATMQRLYTHGLTTCSGGNISLRIDKNHFLITPSALDKGAITYRQIAVFTFSGENLTPELKPSIETDMHRKILMARDDINAVVHAHPKYASFFSATKSHRIRTDLLAEARYLLKDPVFAPYALMGTTGLGDNTAAALKKDVYAAILENHGIVTVGKTLLQAFDRIEVLEAAAEMTIMAKLVDDLSPLNDYRLKEIDAM
ncbi:MAG: class II aldolase/adducin family protein [Bacteroidetes bacterium]|nr:class II aldolase/adducin family protein [Bacteroidota bacterium]